MGICRSNGACTSIRLISCLQQNSCKKCAAHDVVLSKVDEIATSSLR